MTTTSTPLPAKPSNAQELSPSEWPKPQVDKPDVPFNLDDALSGSLELGEKSRVVTTPDFGKDVSIISAELKGLDPQEYSKSIMAKRTDPQKMAGDDTYAKEKTEIFLSIGPAETGKKRSDIAAKLSVGERQVGHHSEEVTAQLLKDSKLEAMQYFAAENVTDIGKATLEELVRYKALEDILAQNAKDTPMPYPRVGRDAIGWDSRFDSLNQGWLDSKQHQRIIENAQKGDQSAKEFIEEKRREEVWNKITPEQQRDMIQKAADRCLDRVDALGTTILSDWKAADEQGVGVVLLVASNRINSQEKLNAILGLPDGQVYKERIIEIRQKGGAIRLTDNPINVYIYNTINIKPGGVIGELTQQVTSQDNMSFRAEQAFAPPNKGGARLIVKQMMGMESMTPI